MTPRNFYYPFYVQDPYKYKDCALLRTQYLKDMQRHVRRIYKPAPYACETCYNCFESATELGSHRCYSRERLVDFTTRSKLMESVEISVGLQTNDYYLMFQTLLDTSFPLGSIDRPRESMYINFHLLVLLDRLPRSWLDQLANLAECLPFPTGELIIGACKELKKAPKKIGHRSCETVQSRYDTKPPELPNRPRKYKLE